jgi:hypothetical protein
LAGELPAMCRSPSAAAPKANLDGEYSGPFTHVSLALQRVEDLVDCQTLWLNVLPWQPGGFGATLPTQLTLDIVVQARLAGTEAKLL